jgi:hypothetical protein
MVIKPMIKTTTMAKILAIFSLTLRLTVSALAMGSEGVINEEAARLGITKDPLELTPGDIDKLTDKQADGLAKVERDMWGCQGGIFESIEAQNNREWLKKAIAKLSQGPTGTK